MDIAAAGCGEPTHGLPISSLIPSHSELVFRALGAETELLPVMNRTELMVGFGANSQTRDAQRSPVLLARLPPSDTMPRTLERDVGLDGVWS